MDTSDVQPTECGLCHKGKEVVSICGKLFIRKYTNKNKRRWIAAHKMCMQYAADLSQFKSKFKKFGRFDPKEVAKEIKRGKRLICSVCGGREEGKNKKKKLSEYDSWMKGATAGCAVAKCMHSYHLPCAREHGILKRIRKAYGNKDIEIQYKVYCSKEHLNRDWDKMTRDGIKEEFTFTSTDTDSEESDREEESESSDDNQECVTEASVVKEEECTSARNVSRKPLNDASNQKLVEVVSRSEAAQSRQFFDESDFDMNSSQPYPSQIPSTSRKGEEGKNRQQKKTSGSTNKGKTSPSTDFSNDSEAVSSVESEPAVAIKRKKKKLTKKKEHVKGTRSPLVPHTKSAQKVGESAVRKESISTQNAPKSSSKKLVRPENQPTINGFLSELKPVKRLGFDDESTNNHQLAHESTTTSSKYLTVSMGDNEMYLYSPEHHITEAPEFSTPNGHIVPVKNCDMDAHDDSDIEIVDFIEGDRANDKPSDVGNVDANPETSTQKRPGSPLEEQNCQVCKKVKDEPQSLDADSTTGPKVPGAAYGTQAVSDANDASYMSDASGDQSRVVTPVISSVMGSEDYILCIAESRIANAEQGLQLASRVHRAVGSIIPLNRIAFWRQSYEEKYSEQEMQYRLLFMDDLTKHVLEENGEKVHEYIFIRPCKSIRMYMNTIEHNREHLNEPGDNNLYDQYISKVRKSVRRRVQTESQNWKMQCIKENEEIIVLLHIGDELDPNNLIRKKLKFSNLESSHLFKWEKSNEAAGIVESKATEIIRYFSVELGKMTQERSESIRGGFSAYFDSSYTEWWKDVELKTICDWTNEVTSGKITVSPVPNDKIQRDRQKEKESVAITIKKRIITLKDDKTREESESNNSQSQSTKKQAVLIMGPVHENILNVAEYLKKCIPVFCEDKLTAANGTEVMCFADVKEMSLECLTKLVNDLYITLENYDVNISTGVKPGKGPVTCLCLHVTI